MKVILVVAALGLLLACSRLRAAELKVGDLAPDFSLGGSDGNTHRLSDHAGKRAVVLA
jgi:peroxiredoxin Q/BCP